MKIKRLITENFFLITLLIFFSFIFFYRIDYNTLASWDEAWYGSIARDILRSGDFMKMMWNGKPYYDHPPLGFWLMTISYKLFGINEFSTRLPSAFLGLGAIFLIYQTAVTLFKKKTVGFAAALIMGTSVWYTIRVRSGNLDSIFVFFYILTLYCSVRSIKNFRWFPFTLLSFGGLLMTKTLVGSSALVLILFLNWRQLLQVKKHWISILLGIAGFALVVLPWYLVQNKAYSDFVQHHFFQIGTRNKSFSSYLHPMFEEPLFYLHMGVRKWYYIWLASLAFLIVTFKFLRKNVLFLMVWNFIILYPFLTSAETELWHLIPAYLPLAFIIPVGLQEGFALALSLAKRFPFLKKIISIKTRTLLTETAFVLFFVYIAFVQTRIFYNEVFPANRYMPDDVAISKASAKYKKPIFLDDDYVPIAVFYSGQNIQPLAYLPDDKKTLAQFIQSDEKNYVVITRNWVVEDLKSKNIPYKLLERNNSFSIVTNPYD